MTATVPSLTGGWEQLPQRDEADTFDPDTLTWVFDDDALAELYQAIEECVEVVIDLETTGLNEHEWGRWFWPVPARIACAAFTLPRAEHQDGRLDPPNFLLPLAHPESPWLGQWRALYRRICRLIEQTGKPMTNQNLKFDDRWSYAHTGVDLSHQLAWDTQISSHLLDENASTKLKERAPATFGVRRWDDFDLSKPGAALKVPLVDLGLYAARDTYWTWRLACHHRRIMNVGDFATDEPPNDPVEAEEYALGALAVWCAMPTSATLTAIEQRGIRLDREWVSREITELEAVRDEQWENLVSRYEVDSTSDPSFAPTALWFKAWAAAAVDAGDLRVGALTPNGNPQWSKGVLKRQARHGAEVAERLLVYRQATKRLEFLRGWLDDTDRSGRVHATYNAGRVVTGRLSCENPNMQQITAALKPAFVPTPGYLIAEIDYSQLEMRIAAHVADCEPMRDAFLRGEDPHRMLAAVVNRISVSQVTSEQRKVAKPGNFGLLYGMGPEGFVEYADDAYGVVLTLDEATVIYEAFFSLWAGMRDWHHRVVAQAYANGQVTSPIGRVRRLPDLYSSNDRARSHAERNAINSPVQGFGSDLMQIAAASIEGNLPGYRPVPNVRLVGTVHDSILVEVPEDDWKLSTARCMKRMTNLAPVLAQMGCVLSVPFAAEASVSTRWGLSDVGIISG